MKRKCDRSCRETGVTVWPMRDRRNLVGWMLKKKVAIHTKRVVYNSVNLIVSRRLPCINRVAFLFLYLLLFVLSSPLQASALPQAHWLEFQASFWERLYLLSCLAPLQCAESHFGPVFRDWTQVRRVYLVRQRLAVVCVYLAPQCLM